MYFRGWKAQVKERSEEMEGEKKAGKAGGEHGRKELLALAS